MEGGDTLSHTVWISSYLEHKNKDNEETVPWDTSTKTMEIETVPTLWEGVRGDQ